MACKMPQVLASKPTPPHININKFSALTDRARPGLKDVHTLIWNVAKHQTCSGDGTQLFHGVWIRSMYTGAVVVSKFLLDDDKHAYTFNSLQLVVLSCGDQYLAVGYSAH